MDIGRRMLDIHSSMSGIQLVRARDTAKGGVDVGDFESLVKKHHPKLAAVTHVPTNSGLVQPVEAIGLICREHGIWYLVDACQSAGQIALDVVRIGCDFLSAEVFFCLKTNGCLCVYCLVPGKRF